MQCVTEGSRCPLPNETGIDHEIQVSAKITVSEKSAIFMLAKSKGTDGLTGFLRLLAKAKEVKITI
jgi:hypothetical protein